MTRLPGYLLKAPEEDLARWKAAARKRGVSFAAYARAALDTATAATPVREVRGKPPAAAVEAPTAVPEEKPVGRRTPPYDLASAWKPDSKPVAKPSKRR